MIDMYHPILGAHYLASPSQVRVLKKSGWWVYSEWLAAQTPVVEEPAPEPTPEPTPTEPTATEPVDEPVL